MQLRRDGKRVRWCVASCGLRRALHVGLHVNWSAKFTLKLGADSTSLQVLADSMPKSLAPGTPKIRTKLLYGRMFHSEFLMTIAGIPPKQDAYFTNVCLASLQRTVTNRHIF